MKLNENDEYDCLIKIHPKIDKFIVLDTETTGLSKKDHIRKMIYSKQMIHSKQSMFLQDHMSLYF